MDGQVLVRIPFIAAVHANAPHSSGELALRRLKPKVPRSVIPGSGREWNGRTAEVRATAGLIAVETALVIRVGRPGTTVGNSS